jgi:hypothetical protein
MWEMRQATSAILPCAAERCAGLCEKLLVPEEKSLRQRPNRTLPNN